MTIGVLFVCTANICRSPMAEGVFRTLARRAGLAEAFKIASAGTTSGHAGEAPTPAAIEAAARRGYDIAGQRSRPVTKEDIAAASMAAGVGAWPAWTLEVPAEAMANASSRPARRARMRNTPSAMGERQMFAVQTKRTPMVMASQPSTALD